MIKKAFVYFIITITLTNCSYIEVNKPAPEINKVKMGNKFFITLPENHTTGYMWQISNTSKENKNIEYLSSVWHGNEKGVYFNFIAKQKGIAKLDFHLMKYKDTSDIKTFIINVTN